MFCTSLRSSGVLDWSAGVRVSPDLSRSLFFVLSASFLSSPSAERLRMGMAARAAMMWVVLRFMRIVELTQWLLNAGVTLGARDTTHYRCALQAGCRSVSGRRPKRHYMV